MTKQRHYVTKLRLSSFFRCLAALCLLKICVLGMLLLDMPFLNGNRPGEVGNFFEAGARQGVSSNAPVAKGELSAGKTNIAEIGGNARRSDGEFYGQIIDAAPVVSNGSPMATGSDAPKTTSLLIARQIVRSDAPMQDDTLLNMLGLTSLPIPSLGGVRAVAAAALDLPAPAASQTGPSPFAPAEQMTPLTMPGAPPIPGNIPRGQSSAGQPLPPRVGQGATSPAFGGSMPPLSLTSNASSIPQLAPNVAPMAMPEDPNAKAQELARQQQDILMLRQQMDDRLKDIENAEQKIQGMIREAKGLEDKKVRHLIQMYANMKPKVAAKAIESLDERVAVRILSGMVAKQSGEILTYTVPEKTAKLTELLTRMRLPEE